MTTLQNQSIRRLLKHISQAMNAASVPCCRIHYKNTYHEHNRIYNKKEHIKSTFYATQYSSNTLSSNTLSVLKKCIISTTMIAVWGTSVAAHSQASTDAPYHIEVMIINNTYEPAAEDSELWSNRWPNSHTLLPPRFANVASAPLSSLLNQQAHKQYAAADALKLEKIASRLAKKSQYDILLHTAWKQDISKHQTSTPTLLTLPQVTQGSDEIFGSINCYKKGHNLIISPDIHWLTYNDIIPPEGYFTAQAVNAFSGIENGQLLASHINTQRTHDDTTHLAMVSGGSSSAINQLITHQFDYVIDMGKITYLDHPKMSMLVLVTPSS